ncbi:MAG: hypothetical protein PWP27_2070 [Clostridiales bacterium]|jgi:hypothetical protein|nr:hypothetical protein [Clostridiales bacterium]MDK2934260.1 hypothetical protein [Clostridiales bacterium]
MIDIIVNEIELSFNRLEKEIYAAACKMACSVLSNILEEMDKKLAQERDKSNDFVIKKICQRLLDSNKILF